MNLFEKKLFNYDFDGTIVYSNEIKNSAYQKVLCNNENLLIKLKDITKKNNNLDRYGIFRNYVIKKKI